jgi:hypothetical protein
MTIFKYWRTQVSKTASVYALGVRFRQWKITAKFAKIVNVPTIALSPQV